MKLLTCILALICFQNILLCRSIKEGESFFTSARQFRQALPDRLITQQDFSTGTFTITQSGTYALAESIQFTGTTGITIAANNVVLDLNGHTISTANISATVISVNGFKNIIVSNGFINGGLNSITFAFVNNGLITQIGILNSLTGGVGIGLQDPQLVAVEECQVQGTSANNSFGVLIGYTQLAKSCSIKNCIFDSFSIAASVQPNSTGLKSITQFVDTIFSRSTQGFETRSDAQANLFNCTATNITGIGFNLVATSNGSFYGCLANSCATGFLVAGNSTVINCIAQNTTTGAFQVGIGASNSAFINCISENNSADGFTISSPNSIVKGCISKNNTGGARGYVYAVSTGNAFANNVAYSNSGANFVNAPANSLNATGLTGPGSVQAVGATFW